MSVVPGKARGRRAAVGLAVAASTWVIAVSAGCTTVLAGTATKAGGPAPPVANLALLDPGNYPRQPRPPLGTVTDEDAGRRVEAQRMANLVVGPWEVDPQLQVGRVGMTSAWTKVELLSELFGPALEGVAAAHHYLVGFSSARTSPTPGQGQPAGGVSKALTNAVLRFASPEDAAAAAPELAAANMAIPRQGVTATRLNVPRYPATVANVAAFAQHFEAEAFTAHGPYVLYQYAGSKDSADIVADLVAKTLDLQGPLVDHFQATPANGFASLPADPTGLLARTVPATNPGVNQSAVYEQRGSEQFRPVPIETQALFNDAGIQRVSIDRTSVYQAIDSTGALRAADGLIRIDAPLLGYKPADAINGMPAARCFDRGTADPQLAPLRYLCIGPAGRYAIKVTGAQELDVHQAISAQYLMLTAS